MLINKDMAATAIVAASASTRGIGWKGDLPWNLPGDLRHFAKLTKGCSSSTTTTPKVGKDGTVKPPLQNAVVMGRNTWNSIPPKFRPLKGRTNVVLTSNAENLDAPQDVLVADSLPNAWEKLANLDNLGQIFVIGGSRVYQEAMEQCYVHKVVLTEVETPEDMEFDTFFPEFLEEGEWELQESSESKEENGLTYKFLTYTRPNTQEEQYLDLIRKILKDGIERGDRTGTGTKSLFGAQMRFDLRNGQLPLLTTKRTFWRGVAEELLWFISGSTNAKLLQVNDINTEDISKTSASVSTALCVFRQTLISIVANRRV